MEVVYRHYLVTLRYVQIQMGGKKEKKKEEKNWNADVLGSFGLQLRRANCHMSMIFTRSFSPRNHRQQS